jgi:hypothetical protein
MRDVSGQEIYSVIMLAWRPGGILPASVNVRSCGLKFGVWSF